MLITNELVANLYLATMGRTMASAGYDYWTNTGDYDGQDGRPEGTNLTTMEELSASFAAQPEYAALYPEGTTDEAFVNQIFQNLFQRDAASSYWADEITAGNTTRAEAVMSIISGAIGDDAAILVNRAEVAIDLADNTVLTAADAMDADTTAALNAITSDVATKATAVTAVNTVVADNATAIEEAAFTLELGAKTAIKDIDGAEATVSDDATLGTLSSLNGYTMTVTLDNSTQKALFDAEFNVTPDVETYSEVLKIAAANEVTGTAYIQNADGDIIGTSSAADLNTTGSVSSYVAQNLDNDDVTVTAAATADENLSFTITFNSAASVADMEAIVEGLSSTTTVVDTAADDEGELITDVRGTKDVTVTLTNPAGEVVATDTQTIKNDDDALVFASAGGTGTYDATDADTFPASTFDIAAFTADGTKATVDAGDVSGSSTWENTVMTVSITANAEAGDVLSFDGTTVTTQVLSATESILKVSDTPIGTVTGGSNGEDLVITMATTGDAVTDAVINSLMTNTMFSTDAIGTPRTINVSIETSDNFAIADFNSQVTVYGGSYTSITSGTLTGSALADIFTLDSTDVANGDVIDGAAGDDTMNLALTNETLDSTFTVSNVEDINITSATTGSSIDMTNVTGADVTVAGAGTTTLTEVGTTITSIDASTATGALAATITGAATHDVKMAIAASSVTFTGVLDSTDTVTGGAGTTDAVTANEIADATTLAFTSSDVESINLNAADTADATITYDGTNNAGASTVNVNTLIAGQTVVVTDVNADTTTLDADGVAGTSTITVATATDIDVTTSEDDSTVDMTTTLDAQDSITGGAGDDSLTAEMDGQHTYALNNVVTTITLAVASDADADVLTITIGGVTYTKAASTAENLTDYTNASVNGIFFDEDGEALATTVGTLATSNGASGDILTFTPAAANAAIAVTDFTFSDAGTDKAAIITQLVDASKMNTVTGNAVDAPDAATSDVYTLTIDGEVYTSAVYLNSADTTADLTGETTAAADFFTNAAGETAADNGYSITYTDGSADTFAVSATNGTDNVSVTAATMTDSNMVVTTAAIETVNLDVTADTSVDLAGLTGATELVLTGASDLTVTDLAATVVSIDASDFTGNLDVQSQVADNTQVTVLGGTGTTDKVTLKDGITATSADFEIDSVETLALDDGALTLVDADYTANGSATLIVEATGTTTVDASGLTAANSVNITTDADFSANTISGGASTADSLTFAGTESIANVSGIETITVTDPATAGTTTVTYADAVTALDKTTTITAAALTAVAEDVLTVAAEQTFVIDASGETNGTLTIVGSAGADTITSGQGADTLTLGTGVDTLVVNSATSNGTDGRDTVSDFVSGTDKLSYTYTMSGVTSFDGRLTNVSAYGDVAENIKTSTVGNTTMIADSNRLYIDTNGDSALNSSDYSVVLTDNATLAEGDIVYSVTTAGTANETIITGGGDDTVNMLTDANLTTDDTIQMGAGTDTLNILAASGEAVVDDMTGVEIIKLDDATTATVDVTLTYTDDNTDAVTIDATDLTNSSAVLTLDATDANVKGALTVKGGTANDIIMTGAGADVINGMEGNDTIYADGKHEVQTIDVDTTSGNAATVTVSVAGYTTTYTSDADATDAEDAIAIAAAINADSDMSALVYATVSGTIATLTYKGLGDYVQADATGGAIATTAATTTAGTATSSNDTINAGAGVDTIYGGAGNDTINLENVADVATVATTTEGATSVKEVQTLTLSGNYEEGDIITVTDSSSNGITYTVLAADIDAVNAVTLNNLADKLVTAITDGTFVYDATATGDTNIVTLTETATGGADLATTTVSTSNGTDADKVVFEATAATNGVDTVTGFAIATDLIDVKAFETAGSEVEITGSKTTTAGTVYELGGLSAGDADSLSAAAAAITAAATWTDADATAWVILSDDDSTSIYEWADTAAGTAGAQSTELTLVGTIDAAMTSGEIATATVIA